MKRVLLNSHRQALHDVLLSHDIDPALTRWTNDKKGWTSGDVETLEVGMCHFLIKPDHDGTFSVFLYPGEDGGAPEGLVNQTWPSVRSMFFKWGHHVHKELEHTDPWSQYSAYVPPERSADATDNTPFTHIEAERVIDAVHKLQQHIRAELPHYKDAATRFDPQFERLKEQATKGLGRIDWSNQFVGFLISLCLALGLAPEQASALWKFWARLIGGLLLPP